MPQRIKRPRHVGIATPALTDAVHSDAVAIRLASIFTPLLFPDRRVSPIENAILGTTSRQWVRRLRTGQLRSLTRGDERNFLR